MIDPTTRNGSFESTPTGATWAALPNWDPWGSTGVAGNNDNRSYRVTDGSNYLYVQGNRAGYNLTGHTIAVGDEISWSFDNTNYSFKGGLVYNDGGTVTFFNVANTFGIGSSGFTNAEPGNIVPLSGVYTVQSGDAWVGKELGFGIENRVGSYSGLDNVQLSVTAIPEPSTFALAGLVLAGLTLRRRRG